MLRYYYDSGVAEDIRERERERSYLMAYTQHRKSHTKTVYVFSRVLFSASLYYTLYIYLSDISTRGIRTNCISSYTLRRNNYFCENGFLCALRDRLYTGDPIYGYIIYGDTVATFDIFVECNIRCYIVGSKSKTIFYLFFHS